MWSMLGRGLCLGVVYTGVWSVSGRGLHRGVSVRGRGLCRDVVLDGNGIEELFAWEDHLRTAGKGWRGSRELRQAHLKHTLAQCLVSTYCVPGTEDSEINKR